MNDTELMQELTKKIYQVIRMLKYDLKQDEKFVYQRDAKEILEILGALDKKSCECSDCKREFETTDEKVNCPYCGSGDVIIYE